MATQDVHSKLWEIGFAWQGKGDDHDSSCNHPWYIWSMAGAALSYRPPTPGLLGIRGQYCVVMACDIMDIPPRFLLKSGRVGDKERNRPDFAPRGKYVPENGKNKTKNNHKKCGKPTTTVCFEPVSMIYSMLLRTYFGWYRLT